MSGREFELRSRQQPKRALVEMPELSIVDSARNPVVYEKVGAGIGASVILGSVGRTELSADGR
jgi:hypothetical protein